MSDNFADRLLSAIAGKGCPVCVGLDPVYESLPNELAGADKAGQLDAVSRFCREVLELVAPIVPAVKPQSAYFEVYGGAGVDLYFDLVRQAKQMGLIVIGDVKRGDIGSTASAYADAHLAGPDTPDAITVNGYLGADGIEPFMDVAERDGKGVFVLVRTSNPSAAQTQDIVAGDKAYYEVMAEQVAGLGDRDGLVGQRGYSSLGAVVGATWPDQAKRLREIMPRQLFLVPGYGAQGASADDCAASFDQTGAGAIVNASRSIIYAHRRDQYKHLPWRQAIVEAAEAFASDIRTAVTSQTGTT